MSNWRNIRKNGRSPLSDGELKGDENQKMGKGSDSGKGWAVVKRHPIFPVFVFIVVSMITGEFYPFSPFSMYSNPSPKPLRFCYLADEEGKALPVLWHTGVSPASMTKKYNTHRGELEEAMEKDPHPTLNDDAIRAESGKKVLNWVRTLSQKRPNRELKQSIQLIEVAISAEESGLAETTRAVAELEAMAP